MTREQCAGLKPGDKVYVTTGCPDGNPRRIRIQEADRSGYFIAFCAEAAPHDFAHLTAAEALAHFEELRAKEIARVEKQIRTLPDRLAKLKARQPVIKE